LFKLLYVSLISGVSKANVVGALLHTDYRFQLWQTVYDQVSATRALLCWTIVCVLWLV